MTTTTLNLKFKGTDYQVPFTSNQPNAPIQEIQENCQCELDNFPNSMLSLGIYPTSITHIVHSSGYHTWIHTFALKDSIESFNLGPILKGKLIKYYSDPEVYSEEAQIITTNNSLTIVTQASI